MIRRLTPLIVVFFIFAFYAVLTASVYPHLQDRLASHFGANGAPDGWMQKDAFVISYGVCLLLMTLLIGGTSVLFQVVPTELINLPNKEYWLGSERRESTLANLEKSMSSLAMLTGVLMILLAEQIYQANLSARPRLGPVIWIDLGLYFVFLVIWTLGLLRRFEKPTAD